MFKTHAGPVEDEGSVAYLRPETAQGIFTNFKNVLETSRKKPPFGIAQVGKSFRNEITPQNFIFRTREFEQMEMEYFVPPGEGPKWFEHWCGERMRWYTDLGIPEDDLRLRPHDADELSHYSSGTSDIEYRYPWGWGELEGIAQRTDFDLKRHAEASGEKLEYFDQASGERYVPHVVEPAAGATRSMMAFLLSAYDEDEVNGEPAHGAAAAPPPGAVPGRRAAPLQEGPAAGAGPGGPALAPALRHVRLRRDAGHRAALPAPGRDRHALLRDGRLRQRRGPGGRPSGSGTRSSRSGSRSTPSSASSATASTVRASRRWTSS